MKSSLTKKKSMNEVFERYMTVALEEAQKAFDEEEIPIGAIIVLNDKIIAQSHNTNRQSNDPTAHAEIKVIQEAAKKIKNERLLNCDLYVTKEPCAMCSGAIVHSRIKRVIIGTTDQKYGACGTVLSVCGNPILNHIPEIITGILHEESATLLKDFFRKKRK